MTDVAAAIDCGEEARPHRRSQSTAARRIGCISSLAPAQVAAWPGVQEARAGDDGRLQLIAAQAEPVVRRLLAEDPSLSELEVRRAGLADAFLALTGRPDAATAAIEEEAA